MKVCLMLITSPLQQWLRESASMLRYTYIDCVNVRPRVLKYCSWRDIGWRTQFQLTQFLTYVIFFWNIEIKTLFLKKGPNFYLREWERLEIKLEEEYCWAITPEAERSCCGRSVLQHIGVGILAWLPFFTQDTSPCTHSNPNCAIL